jgi:hypothetical protein
MLHLYPLMLCQHNPFPVVIPTANDQAQDKVIRLDAGDDDLIKPFDRNLIPLDFTSPPPIALQIMTLL